MNTTTAPSFAEAIVQDREVAARIAAADKRDRARPAIELLLVSIRQAGEALQLTPRDIERLIDAGDLEAYKIGNKYRISFECLRRFASTGPTA